MPYDLPDELIQDCQVSKLEERTNEALAEWGKKNRDNLLACNADKKALRELKKQWGHK